MLLALAKRCCLLYLRLWYTITIQKQYLGYSPMGCITDGATTFCDIIHEHFTISISKSKRYLISFVLTIEETLWIQDRFGACNIFHHVQWHNQISSPHIQGAECGVWRFVPDRDPWAWYRQLMPSPDAPCRERLHQKLVSLQSISPKTMG